VDVEANDNTEGPATRRPRPWLGMVCAVALVACAVGWWWHVEDPFNPYRDGTTHAATLVHSNPPCLNGWQVTLDGGRYLWQNLGEVPAALGPGPIHGRLHIIRQRSPELSGPRALSATFEADGQTIELQGGREPVFFYAVCAIR
jgi:hypothetical protein